MAAAGLRRGGPARTASPADGRGHGRAARARFSPPSSSAIAGLAVAFACSRCWSPPGGSTRSTTTRSSTGCRGSTRRRRGDTIPPVAGVFLPFDLDPSPWWHELLDAVMYPASVVVSLTVFAVGCRGAVAARREDRRRRLGGDLVRRERDRGAREGRDREARALPHEGRDVYHLASFDHSFPSGHAMRAVLVAALVLYVWRRLGWVAAAWVLARADLPRRRVVARALGRHRRRPLRLPRVLAAFADDRRGRGAPAVVEPAGRRRRAARAGRGGRARRSAARARLRRRAARRAARGGAARRRGGASLLVLAAGGDPHRELDVDAPAVKSLAADLLREDAARAARRRRSTSSCSRRASCRTCAERRSSSPPTSTSPGGCWRSRSSPTNSAPRMLRPRDSDPFARADPCLKSGTSIE